MTPWTDAQAVLAEARARGDCREREWRPVVDFPGYEVSNDGEVRSAPKSNRYLTILLRKIPCKSGDKPGPKKYYQVRLTREAGKPKNRPIHILVATAFIGLKPFPKAEVAHLDGDGFNNRDTNLAWATRVENEAHKVIHGRVVRGERVIHSRLSEDSVRAIRSRIAEGHSQKAIAATFGVSPKSIKLIRVGRTWGWLP